MNDGGKARQVGEEILRYDKNRHYLHEHVLYRSKTNYFPTNSIWKRFPSINMAITCNYVVNICVPTVRFAARVSASCGSRLDRGRFPTWLAFAQNTARNKGNSPLNRPIVEQRNTICQNPQFSDSQQFISIMATNRGNARQGPWARTKEQENMTTIGRWRGKWKELALSPFGSPPLSPLVRLRNSCSWPR